MPSITYNSVEEVPEGLRDGAKEVDGKFVVRVVLEDKLNEFRESNITLRQQLDTLGPIVARVKTLAGEDLDAFERDLEGLRDISQRVKDGELKTNDQIEAAVNERVKAIREGYESNEKAARDAAIKAEQKALTLQQRLDQTVIQHHVTQAVISPESGVRTEALPDILERAFRLFKMEEGKPVPKNGEATIYGSNGADPMSVSEWLTKLRTEAPHFFKGNNGGGADGGKGGKIGGFTPQEIAGLTAQQKLELANGTLKRT